MSDRYEAVLLDLVRDVLDTDQIGVDDDILQFDADSITVLRLVGRAHEAGVPTTVADVFEYRTTTAIARRARETGVGGTRVWSASGVSAAEFESEVDESG
jgi:aryl carrier-like protein